MLKTTREIGKNPLLYLTLEVSLRLGKALRRLRRYLEQDVAPTLEIHVIRKELSDLTFYLSPVSPTRRFLIDIVNRTGELPIKPADRNLIEKSANDLMEIYALSDLCLSGVVKKTTQNRE